MEDKLLKIINHYGVLNQLKYIHTEYFELDEAIMDYEYSDGNNTLQIEHIAEEIADVMVMIEQFKCYYGITDEQISKNMIYKIRRQLERIEFEQND